MLNKFLVVLFSVTLSSAALADGGHGGGHDNPNEFSLLEVNDAMLTSLQDLTDSDPETADAVYGFQGQISDDDAKIRFYVRSESGSTTRVNYLCHKHEGEAECHRQSN